MPSLCVRRSSAWLRRPPIVLLDTGEHGTDILEFGDPAAADEFRRSVLDLLAGI